MAAHSGHGHLRVNNVLVTVMLNIVITIAQVIGGAISGSMALISDAAHNFSDVLSLLISYIASRLTGKEETVKKTFGYRRAGILAAFINTSTLLVISAILAWVALSRILKPLPVEGSVVMILAAFGILLNGLSLLFIRKDAAKSINFRAAFIHLLSDLFTSVGVLAGGLIIKISHWYRVDGAISMLIAAYMFYSSWGILRETIKIFMQFTPPRVNIEDIAGEITKLEGVKNIHHVHVWQLDDDEMIFEAHIDLDMDYSISAFEEILEKIGLILETKDISHFNIQPELYRDDMKELINTGRK